MNTETAWTTVCPKERKPPLDLIEQFEGLRQSPTAYHNSKEIQGQSPTGSRVTRRIHPTAFQFVKDRFFPIHIVAYMLLVEWSDLSFRFNAPSGSSKDL